MRWDGHHAGAGGMPRRTFLLGVLMAIAAALLATLLPRRLRGRDEVADGTLPTPPLRPLTSRDLYGRHDLAG